MIFALAILVLAALILPLLVVPCYPATCLLEQLDRFQTLIAGLVGFGGLIAAAIYNGQQDRAKEERTETLYVKNLAHALALEARELGIECGHIAVSADELLAALKELASKKGDQVASFDSQIRKAAQPQDTLLERISPPELSRLGFNVYGFGRITRLGLRKARSQAATGNRNNLAEWLTEISDSYLRCAVNCRRLSELMEVVANEGVAAANKLEAPKSARDEDVAAERKKYTLLRLEYGGT